MSNSSCRSCARISMKGKGLRSSPMSPSATRPLFLARAQMLIALNFIPRAMAASAMPSWRKNSSVRACMTSAREVVPGALVLSMMRTPTPRRASQSASMRPVGPAPTMRIAALPLLRDGVVARLAVRILPVAALVVIVVVAIDDHAAGAVVVARLVVIAGLVHALDHDGLRRDEHAVLV